MRSTICLAAEIRETVKPCNMMNIHTKRFLIIAALLGAGSIVIAAIGAHAIYDRLVSAERLETFNKAIDYSTTGALTLAAIAALQQALPQVKFFISGYLITLGTLLFSGSLFIYIVTDYRPVTALTPIGGTLLIIAWLSLGIIAVRQKTHNAS